MGDKPEFDYFKALIAGPPFCFACGCEIEKTTDGYANHKCPPKSELAKKAADVRHRDTVVRRRELSDRLEEGFRMLQEEEHGR